MPLNLQFREGRIVPCISCDQCGEIVAQAQRAKVLHMPPGSLISEHPEVREEMPDHQLQYFFVHSHCVREFDRYHQTPDGRGLSSMSLNDFLIHLNHNCGGVDESKVLEL